MDFVITNAANAANAANVTNVTNVANAAKDIFPLVVNQLVRYDVIKFIRLQNNDLHCKRIKDILLNHIKITVMKTEFDTYHRPIKNEFGWAQGGWEYAYYQKAYIDISHPNLFGEGKIFHTFTISIKDINNVEITYEGSRDQNDVKCENQIELCFLITYLTYPLKSWCDIRNIVVSENHITKYDYDKMKIKSSNTISNEPSNETSNVLSYKMNLGYEIYYVLLVDYKNGKFNCITLTMD